MLGRYLVERGFVTEEQLREALGRQADLRAQGQQKRIGELLVEMGYVSASQVRSVLAQQVAREHFVV